MGMGSSGMVVATHCVTLLAFAWVSWLWVPWLRRQMGELLRNPMGLIVLAFGALAWLAAASALYYGTARVLHYTAAVSLWTGAWAVVITAMQSAAPVALLLALMARWRTLGLGGAEVSRRAMLAVAAGASVWLGVAWVLW